MSTLTSSVAVPSWHSGQIGAYSDIKTFLLILCAVTFLCIYSCVCVSVRRMEVYLIAVTKYVRVISVLA